MIAEVSTLKVSVALLAEGVDRNMFHDIYSPFYSVALLAEGVDRNVVLLCDGTGLEDVALLAEGVDRNTSCLPSPLKADPVALLAEGVDRNLSGTWGVTSPDSRPPRGGRG